MDNSTTTNNKILTVSYMVAGLLVGVVVSVLLETLAAVATGSISRMLEPQWLRHGLPVVLGLATFVFLQASSGVNSWGDEVVTEIRRVVWPSRKDTTSMTVVVCIMLVLSGIAFGILDVMSGSIVDWLLHKNFMGILG